MNTPSDVVSAFDHSAGDWNLAESSGRAEKVDAPSSRPDLCGKR